MEKKRKEGSGEKCRLRWSRRGFAATAVGLLGIAADMASFPKGPVSTVSFVEADHYERLEPGKEDEA